MGRKSRAKREQRAQHLADRRSLNQKLKSSDPSEQVAHCLNCGGVTAGIQASGLYEGLTFDLSRTCPTCNHRTEIIPWAEWQSREPLMPPANPPSPSG